MSIASEILRIKNARDKIRSKAVKLELKKWKTYYEQEIDRIETEPYFSHQFNSGVNSRSASLYRVRLSFDTEEEASLAYDAAYFEVCVFCNTLEGDPYYIYDGSDGQIKKVLNGRHIDFIFDDDGAPPCEYYISVTSDCDNVYCSVDSFESLVGSDKIVAVADAIDGMTVKSGETITANGTLSDGYYKGCSVLPEQFGTVVLYDNDTPMWHVTDWANGDISYVFNKGMTWAEAFQEDVSVSRYSDYALGEKIFANGYGYVYEDFHMKFLLTPDGRYVHKDDAVCYHRYDLTSTAPNA